MEARKIAAACFIGGSLCCAGAFVFAPVYWWFGLVAGVAGGYVGYEFREVLNAIPVALRAVGQGGASAWSGVIVLAKRWLSKPHPFFYPAAVVCVPLYIWGAFPLLLPTTLETHSSALITFLAAAAIVVFVELMVAVSLLFVGLAFIGARVGERCYWWPFLLIGPHSMASVQKAWSLEGKGYRREPLTYRNVARWANKGFGLAVLFFVWTLWKHLAIGVWATLYFSSRFAWHLFGLIHSEKRVLCAIDGTLGGAVSYVWLASTSTSFTGQATLIIFGGLLGAAFGVANWEIVSKRVLRVSVSGASA